jgi:branched-chain amino acid transport system ATP-binding protein
VLHDVTFRARESEVVALLGRTGAGKTSALKSIMGLVRPAAGRVLFGTQRIDGKPPEQIARLGVVPVPQAAAVLWSDRRRKSRAWRLRRGARDAGGVQ